MRKRFQSCVTPEGKFIYGIHKPQYAVDNLRSEKNVKPLGKTSNGNTISNEANFPETNLEVTGADWIFEIHNPFPFRGTTYIDKEWADNSAANIDKICLPKREPLSFSSFLKDQNINSQLIKNLPEQLLLTLATCSTDPQDLVELAKVSCNLVFENDNTPCGLEYTQLEDTHPHPIIHNHTLFEAVANNPYLPDPFKIAMVIRPGAQGKSEIVGDYHQKETNIYEYLRRNSYIAGGHYAANMADNSIRYSIGELSIDDIKGLRHLYYQRTYIRLATELGFTITEQQELTKKELEKYRTSIIKTLKTSSSQHTATLWGWNFGFDYAPSGYRLHASHQQVHQQYAMLPSEVESFAGDPQTPTGRIPSYGCGDLIKQVIEDYANSCKGSFFNDYLQAILNNERMDGRKDRHQSLIIWQDPNTILFVPKAQTSQWEVQIMTLPDTIDEYAGNILETDQKTRNSIDKAIFMGQKALYGLGAEMVTSIEFPKRIDNSSKEQPLLYALLPRLPESPGAFSETQLRFINGHYPEDFANACKKSLIKQELL